MEIDADGLSRCMALRANALVRSFPPPTMPLSEDQLDEMDGQLDEIDGLAYPF